MHVALLGSPASGKTTTASTLFSRLKAVGAAAEFVPEYARTYIAAKRLKECLHPRERLSLTDDDQLRIMRGQLDLETLFCSACGPDVCVVGDSSALCAPLYMSESVEWSNGGELIWTSAEVLRAVDEALSLTDVLLVAGKTEALNANRPFDPNRVHDASESLEVDNRIQRGLLAFLRSRPAFRAHVTALSGSHLARVAQAERTVYYALGVAHG